MPKKQQEFDAVRMMREIRDRLSEKMESMSFEEQKRFIRQELTKKASTKTKRKPA